MRRLRPVVTRPSVLIRKGMLRYSHALCFDMLVLCAARQGAAIEMCDADGGR